MRIAKKPPAKQLAVVRRRILTQAAGGRRYRGPFGEGASASAQAVIAIENTRATDDLEPIGGGGLLLEGFAQLIA
jgi:hypothetical protein